jgi:hypothetical protein
VDLDAVAVEIDFVNPAGAARHLLDRAGQGRFDEAGSMKQASALWRQLPPVFDAETLLKNSTLQLIQIGTVWIVPEPANPWRVAWEPMETAKKTARGRKQDRARVAGRQDYELQHESKKTGRSATAVKKAVKKVGNSRKRVEKRLGRWADLAGADFPPLVL